MRSPLIVVFLSGILFVLSNVVFGQEIKIGSPDPGDTININSFTLVAKAEMPDAHWVCVCIHSQSEDPENYGFTCISQEEEFKHHAYFEIDIIEPKPRILAKKDKFPIVAHIRGLVPAERLTIEVMVANNEENEIAEYLEVLAK